MDRMYSIVPYDTSYGTVTVARGESRMNSVVNWLSVKEDHSIEESLCLVCNGKSKASRGAMWSRIME